MADVHEFVVLSFKDGIAKDEQIELMQNLEKFVSLFNGFKRREIFFSEADNRWIDHVVWADMDLARASGKVTENPDAAVIFGKMDERATIFSLYDKIE